MVKENCSIDKILEEIALGSSLIKACRENHSSPTHFYKQINENKKLEERYARACEERKNWLAESIYDDIEESKQKIIDPATARVSIDAKKWLLSKLEPKKYGDRASVELTGSEGGAIELSHTVDIGKIKELNEMLDG